MLVKLLPRAAFKKSFILTDSAEKQGKKYKGSSAYKSSKESRFFYKIYNLVTNLLISSNNILHFMAIVTIKEFFAQIKKQEIPIRGSVRGLF